MTKSLELYFSQLVLQNILIVYLNANIILNIP